MNVVSWDLNHLFDCSEDVGEGDHGEEGQGDHHGESRWYAVNVGEEINSSHWERAAAVSGIGNAACADLALAFAVNHVVSAIGNAIADKGLTILVPVAVELDVAKDTGFCACAAQVLGLSAVGVSSAPWSKCAVISNILGGNGREEAGSEGEGDELVHLIYLYYYKSLFDNSQNIKRRKTTPRDAIFKFIETSH